MRRLEEEFGVVLILIEVDRVLYLRISAQIYNSLHDYERAADALLLLAASLHSTSLH